MPPRKTAPVKPKTDEILLLDLDKIRTDGGTQTRAQMSAQTIAEYADAIRAGATFPSGTVFYDGESYWLADGFQRKAAHKAANKNQMAVTVKQGTKRDALAYSLSANSEHGLRRSNADKRRAVELALKDPEWSEWSDGAIAQLCAVSQPFVSGMRKELTPVFTQLAPRKVTRGNQTYTMDTAKLVKPVTEDRIIGVIPAIDEPTSVKPTVEQPPKSEPLYSKPEDGDFWTFGDNALLYDSFGMNSDLSPFADKIPHFAVAIVTATEWAYNWLKGKATSVILCVPDALALWTIADEVTLPIVEARFMGDYYIARFSKDKKPCFADNFSGATPIESIYEGLLHQCSKEGDLVAFVEPLTVVTPSLYRLSRKGLVTQTKKDLVIRDLRSWDVSVGLPITKETV